MRTTLTMKKGAFMPTTIPNAPDAAKTFDLIRDIGTTVGTANDAQIKMDYALIEAGYKGVLDLTKNKHGKGIDDATKAAEIYYTARNKHVRFDYKAPNQRKTASTMRKCLQFGGKTTWGAGQPLQLLNDFMNMWQTLRADANFAKQLNDAHNALMRVIRKQLSLAEIMTPQELRSYMFKPEAKAKDNMKLIEGIEKLAKSLYDGSASHGLVQDQSVQVAAIIAACHDRKLAIVEALRAETAEVKAVDASEASDVAPDASEPGAEGAEVGADTRAVAVQPDDDLLNALAEAGQEEELATA